MRLLRTLGSLLLVSLAACAPGSFDGDFESSIYGDAPLPLQVDRPQPTSDGEPAPLMAVLAGEIERALSELKNAKEPRAYFMSYQVTDVRKTSIWASFGALVGSEEERSRTLDVDVRVGSPEFDNTHPARGSELLVRASSQHPSWQLPLGDDPAMLGRTLWVALDTQYRRAVEEYLKVRGNVRVRADTDQTSNDFTREPPLQFIERRQPISLDRARFEKKLREYSGLFRDHPHVYGASVYLEVEDSTLHLVNSEGSRVQRSQQHARLIISGNTRSADGMDLSRYEVVGLSLQPGLPEDATIRELIASVIADLDALRVAPQATPYVGPAILEGPAAGVFAHEVLGHRLEGHRQKSDDEGQTFATKIGERVLPPFIDVYDDPTIAAVNGIELNGHYWVDDEAVPTRRTSLIEDGVLTGFLMSRSPTRSFDRSSGHGRRQAGNPIVARQGNLIVHPSRTVPAARLKQLLLAEVKRQGKPYGLRFSVVEGGFTNTSRFGVQSFRVNPVMVYRVYPDGREELVRGVSIDGTPLAALSQIIAAGDDTQVFNGVCGAESGSVPVSAVSPSLLLRRLEISGVLSLRDRAPILAAPMPATSDASSSEPYPPDPAPPAQLDDAGDVH